jgi:hypothetical protein
MVRIVAIGNELKVENPQFKPSGVQIPKDVVKEKSCLGCPCCLRKKRRQLWTTIWFN